MQFLHSWLEQYIDLTGYESADLADIISLKSGECEGFTQTNDYFNQKLVVGKITNVSKHPDADKLWIFKVDAGDYGLIPVVSGAPNVAEGLIVPLALVGCQLPYITIASRNLRGYESQGMCCGKDELMLQTEKAEGLWELEPEITALGCNPDEVLGQSLPKVLPHFFPVETIYEIKYLHDQFSSCGSHLGLALELAKVLQKPQLLKGLAKELQHPIQFLENYQEKIVGIEKSDFNLDFVDYTNQTKAFWLFKASVKDFVMPHSYVKRLFLTGKNLVGSVADLSNYLLWDIGQPSHFFSYSKTKQLQTKTWHIGYNDKEQAFAGLGQLKNVNVPIGLPIMTTDSGQIIHLPGLSGGDQTKVEPNDEQILVEVANFPAELVARSSFALNYRSDSSKFWASGISEARMLVFLIKLMEILGQNSFHLVFSFFKDLQLSQANFLQSVRSQLLTSIQEKTIIPNLDYIDQRMDAKSSPERRQKFETLLEHLGRYEQNQLLVNPFYSNLQSQEDLLFELAKLIGFENLQDHFLAIKNNSLPSQNYKFRRWLANQAVEFGLTEIISRPFVSKNHLTLSESSLKTALEAISSQRADENYLRDSVLPSLLQTLSKNQSYGEKNLRFFEVAKIYTQSIFENQTSLIETEVLAALVVDENPYLLTTLLNRISQISGLEILEIEKTEGLGLDCIGSGYIYNFQDNQAKILEISKKMKKIHDLVLNKKIWYLEFEIPKEIKNFSPFKKYIETSNFPVVNRSYSLDIDSNLNWQEVCYQIKQLNFDEVKVYLTPVERFFEEKTENKRSVLNFSVELISYSRTLTTMEIEHWEKEFILELKKLDKEIKMR